MSVPVGATDINRNYANFGPSIWGNTFLQFASQSVKVDDLELKVAREEVKNKFMLMCSNNSDENNLSQKLKLIDSVQRLGVSHHFGGEIEAALGEIHDKYTNNNHVVIFTSNHHLHSLALLFRLLRQQGYPISSDVFKKLKKENGEFNEELANDREGMLALYEAAQLKVDGEEILEEALDFTLTHLINFSSSQFLDQHVTHCLSQPLRKGLPRIQATHYTSQYHLLPSHSHFLLNFAKLDFNTLQKLHQIEIGNITKWWNKSEYMRKVPYARDRVVEAYFWPLGMGYEADYSSARLIMGKFVCCICLLDDTYDSYGTMQELQLFTQAIHRWDISPIQSVPECMKVVFEAVQQLYKEMESLTAKQNTSSFVMPHLKQAIYELSEAYLVEAKWCSEGHIPSYEEYKHNGVVSSTLPLQIASFIGLTNLATKEVFDWMYTNPKIIRAVSLIGRLMDDMATHKFEQERVHVASGVECCMKQYRMSEEEAYKTLQNDILNCWKDINEECLLNSNLVPKAVLDCILNAGRVSEFVYANFQDRFTNGDLLKRHLLPLLLHPMPSQ
ncbi:putative terpene synthase 2 [Senna tora]|uniref:Putative terpene synthase 2 n=1 Tax=Senna tora TaxID=362788 RepID=A0A834WW77_9FABA|nr:putative terpene synthase 2 [Senna tora]